MLRLSEHVSRGAEQRGPCSASALRNLLGPCVTALMCAESIDGYCMHAAGHTTGSGSSRVALG